jgi:hypothetical protein
VGRGGFADFDLNNAALVAEYPTDATDIVKIDKFEREPGELLLTGLKGGTATLRIVTRRGEIVRFRVIVRGRAEDPVRKALGENPFPETRRKWCKAFWRNGRALLKDDPYRAMREFEKALAAEEPLPRTARSRYYGLAQRDVAEVKKVIDREWNALWAEAWNYARRKQYAAVVHVCDRALSLIPDEADPRHQKAAHYRWKYARMDDLARQQARRGR